MPALMEPSPITATTRLSCPWMSRAAAKPRAAEMEVAAWAAPKGSNSLSVRLVKPDSPPPWRRVRMRSRRPVRILWG